MDNFVRGYFNKAICYICGTRFASGPGEKRYTHSSEKDMAKKWKENLGLPDYVDITYLRLCGKHFENLFIGKKRLRGGAIPTLHLPNDRVPIHLPVRGRRYTDPHRSSRFNESNPSIPPEVLGYPSSMSPALLMARATELSEELICLKIFDKEKYEEQIVSDEPSSSQIQMVYAKFKRIFDKIAEPDICVFTPKLSIINELDFFDGSENREISSHIIRIQYTDLIEDYKSGDFRILSTDSYVEGKTGCAIFDERTRTCHLYKVDEMMKSTSAQLLALYEAVSLCESEKYHQIAIFTESKFACDILMKPQKENFIASQIQKRIQDSDIIEAVHLIWTPGHIGLSVIEVVNQGALSAMSTGALILPPLTPDDGLEMITNILTSKDYQY